MRLLTGSPVFPTRFRISSRGGRVGVIVDSWLRLFSGLFSLCLCFLQVFDDFSNERQDAISPVLDIWVG